jgi:hypothetical protein
MERNTAVGTLFGEGATAASGLSADWLNGWLAAVGATVLVPGLQLSWTRDDPPHAVFTPDDPRSDVAATIAHHVPSVERMEEWVAAGLPQKLSMGEFREAAAQARRSQDWSLGLLTTDATTEAAEGKPLATGPFNVGAPRGETLYTRLRACRNKLRDGDELAEAVAATLRGQGRRHPVNGLGFDYRRFPASVPSEGEKQVDPVVEVLCYFGLVLHPVYASNDRLTQRGWRGAASRLRTFCWPAWTEPLDRWAIDALLDHVYRDVARPGRDDAHLPVSWKLRSVSGLFGTVPYRQQGQSKVTNAVDDAMKKPK